MPLGIGKTDVLYNGVADGTKVAVSSSGQDIAGYHLLNTTAAPAYLQIFYKASADVTVGVTVPDAAIPLPTSGGATMQFAGKGWRIPTALTIAGTTTPTGAVGAACHVVLYRNQ